MPQSETEEAVDIVNERLGICHHVEGKLFPNARDADTSVLILSLYSLYYLCRLFNVLFYKYFPLNYQRYNANIMFILIL